MRRTLRRIPRPAVLLCAMLLGGAALAPASQAATATPAAAAQPSCATPVHTGEFRCFALKSTAARIRHLTAGQRPAGLSPADLRSAYELPASWTDATIAIVVAYDNPNAESDLAQYRSTFGLPACTAANACFTKVNQQGAAAPLPAPDPGWAGESSLDLDMVSAACPTCHILLVEADDATVNLLSAVTTAEALGAKYINMSWGQPEVAQETQLDPAVFDHPGVVFTAASGDSGFGNGPYYPAASPEVVSVGATTLTPAHNRRGWTESAWSGSGSGCSAYLAKPAFQDRIAGCPTRATADVSAAGDPDHGVAVYQTYGDVGWGTDGGTSAAAPFIASVYALAGAAGHAGNPASYPYSHPFGLHDVTRGSTGTCTPAVLCTAGTGWDGPTGLGSPAGVWAFMPPWWDAGQATGSARR